MSTQDVVVDEIRAMQNRIWSKQVCEVALGVRHLWQEKGNDLGISEDAVQVIANLAKKSGDNTLSESELAEVSGLTPERAKAAIDMLIERQWAVRRLPKAGDQPGDRRVQLPAEFVRDVFSYYTLQEHHRAILDQFSPEELDVAQRFLEAIAGIANDQATAIKDGRVKAGTSLKASRDASG